MVLSNSEVTQLDSIQHQVARFILQLPSSAANMDTWKQGSNQWKLDSRKLMHKKRDKILTNVYGAVIEASDEPAGGMVGDLVAELGVNLLNGSRSRLKNRLIKVSGAGVQKQKQLLVWLSCMPIPKVWFKLQPHVCNSKAGGLLNRRAQAARLGNHRPNIHGPTTKSFPLCLSEHHVVSCQAVSYERSETGIWALITGKAQSSMATLTGILLGNNASKEVLLKRGKILDRWIFLARSLSW